MIPMRIGMAVSAAVVIALVASCGSSGGSDTAETDSLEVVHLKGKIIRSAVENPSSWGFLASVVNSTSEPVKVECHVEASDRSGAHSGHDLFTLRGKVQPGRTERFTGSLAIDDAGAAFVTRHDIDCRTNPYA